jgi:hypothetical protein
MVEDWDRQYMDEELEGFKTRINLTEYAAGLGYVLDRKASSHNSVAMAGPSGDKIVIARFHDRHWVYFSVHQEHSGTILDLVQHVRGCKLGRARQELRSWSGAGRGRPLPHPDRFRQEIETVSRGRAQVLMDLGRMKDLSFHRYLEAERKIPRGLLQSARFAGKIRIDARSNVIFPHADRDGPCGYEIKNRNFTGFAKGGEKGLWMSAVRKADTTLVLGEAGIDVLSYAALHLDGNTRYASTAGSLSPNQPALIASAIERMGQGASIVIAMDNDEGGRALADQLEAIAAGTRRRDLAILRDLPAGEGGDWNDRLRAAPPSPAPLPGQ